MFAPLSTVLAQVSVTPNSGSIPGGPQLQQIVDGIAGFALINFGVVVAILAYVPAAPNDQAAAAVGAAFAALLGVASVVKGANDFRK